MIFASKPSPDDLNTRVAELSRMIVEYRSGALDEIGFKRLYRSKKFTKNEYDAAIIDADSQASAAAATAVAESQSGVGALHPTIASYAPLVVDALGQCKLPVEFALERSASSYRVHLMAFRVDPKVSVRNPGALLEPMIAKVSIPENTIIAVKPGEEFGQPGFLEFHIPRKDPQTIFFCVDLVPPQDNQGQLKLLFGKDIYGRDLSTENFYHFLIGGKTRSGKSNFAIQVICTLAFWNSPAHMQFALFDLERRTYDRFRGFPWLWNEPCCHADDIEAWLGGLQEERERRRDLFANHGNLWAYNRANPNSPEPVIIIGIDEVRLFSEWDKARAFAFLCDIAERGAALGLIMMIGVQRPSCDSRNGCLPPELMDNICSKFVFQSGRLASDLFGNKDAELLGGNGDGLAYIDGQWVRFQSLYMGSDNGDRIIEGLVRWAQKHHGVRVRPSSSRAEKFDDAWE